MIVADIQGWFDFEGFYDFVVDTVKDGTVLVELGPWRGKSTCYLGLALKKSKPNCMIHAIDTFKGTPGENVFDYMNKSGDASVIFDQNIAALGLSDIVTKIVGDSITESEHYPDESLEFVFFDTDHTESHLTSELKAWLPKLKKGALFGGHDIAMPSVARAVQNVVGKYQLRGSCWFSFKT